MAVKTPCVTPFGTMPGGTPVEQLTLKCGKLTCQIITYGGAVRSLTVPDRNGKPVDVVLGFDTLEDYLRQDKYIGALIGRYANRIGGAHFSLGGKKYALTANDGLAHPYRGDSYLDHLHGGKKGFDKQVWTVEKLTHNAVTLSLISPDGQEGYPGTLTVRVTYRLTSDSLVISYWARSDADTVCNLTNHTYFNLSGHASGPVSHQHVQLTAEYYTPTYPDCNIPNGAIALVEGTPMDLRAGVVIGKGADRDFFPLRQAGGFDQNWIVPGPIGTLRLAGWAWSDKTGIDLEVLTTQSGIQFYSGNYLDGCPKGKGGIPYAKRWGFCLETQAFPDAPNKPHFPSATLPKGKIYRHKTVYRFS